MTSDHHSDGDETVEQSASDTEQKIRTVGDLDPDRDVHHTSRTGGPQRPVHLDDDCRFFENAKRQYSRAARVLDPDRAVCEECTGAVNYTAPKGTDVQATRRRLYGLDPSDVGLSALGERSVDTGIDHE